MNLMDSNNCPVTRLDNAYYPDPTYDKRYGIMFDISFNDTYRGAYNVTDAIQFIQDFLMVPKPTLGVYHIKEVSPGKPSGEALNMLDIIIRMEQKHIVIDVYDKDRSTKRLYTRVQFGDNGVTPSGISFIIGFVQGWAASVAVQTERL